MKHGHRLPAVAFVELSDELIGSQVRLVHRKDLIVGVDVGQRSILPDRRSPCPYPRNCVPLSDTSSMPDHEEVSGRAMGILIRLGDRLSVQTQEIVHELVEHNESGVALEVMADMLAEAGASITDHERNEMLQLVSDMGMDDGVGRSLEMCPRRD